MDFILEAAARVLLAQGYQHTTTNRIAEQAGVSIGTVYEYFADKESILDALMVSTKEQASVLRWVFGATDTLGDRHFVTCTRCKIGA